MERRFSTITRDRLLEMMDQNEDFVLIETLPEESYRKGHLPGAINIPGSEVRARIPEVAPNKNGRIVVYCASPSCEASERAAQILVDMGYTDVHEYPGGKQHWMDGGLEVETEEPATATA